MDLPSVGEGMSLKARAAKHVERRLKFWGQANGISDTEETFCTPFRCFSENPEVMRSMIAWGDGLLEPFVPSAQINLAEPSKRLVRLLIGTG